MAQDFTPQIAKLQRIDNVFDSVTTWIADTNARQKAAVDAALALGATPEQVAPMLAEIDASSAKAEAVAQAISTPLA